MLDTLLFIVGVTLPVCIMLLAGVVLKRTGFIDDHFITVSSRLVFNFGLPAVLFFSLSSFGKEEAMDSRLLLLAFITAVGGFFFSWLLSLKVVPERRDRGIFIQGASRGNLAIIGLALAGNMYGEPGIAQLSLMMAATVPIYNILSVFFLSYYQSDATQKIDLGRIARNIICNPLIIAVFAGVGFSFTGLTIPGVITKVGHYFAQITLPLALLGVGGTLSLQAFTKTSHASFWASLFKVVLLPAATMPLMIWAGYRGMELGTVFLMLSCPTAAASFVMAKAYDGNSDLAANIILLTSIGALPVVSLGLFLMRTWGLI
ncbi:AEC family transporter [Parendozoicomonas haliclonae]|uniref:Putative transporter YfdV n=1 Tax=Parendozoicomonas haliclonae TaxID=1960125 RepID=A0A1X7AGY1_9GAMM|nr:AEC family transporter [Parendozoicomonas haliclonae]SMA40204.1 putative transporter YfdV [Parendozoicomonas haliclonae]